MALDASLGITGQELLRSRVLGLGAGVGSWWTCLLGPMSPFPRGRKGCRTQQGQRVVLSLAKAEQVGGRSLCLFLCV